MSFMYALILNLMYIYSKPKISPFSIKQPNRVPQGKTLKSVYLKFFWPLNKTVYHQNPRPLRYTVFC